MAALVVITLLNVVTRYLTDQSFAWTEEISIVLMVVMTLAGASGGRGARRAHPHRALYDSGSAAAAPPCTALALGRRSPPHWCSRCSRSVLRVVADEVRWAETSMGLGVPRWWFRRRRCSRRLLRCVRWCGVAGLAAAARQHEKAVATIPTIDRDDRLRPLCRLHWR